MIIPVVSSFTVLPRHEANTVENSYDRQYEYVSENIDRWTGRAEVTADAAHEESADDTDTSPTG
jgi:hypothetical protein